MDILTITEDYIDNLIKQYSPYIEIYVTIKSMLAKSNAGYIEYFRDIFLDYNYIFVRALNFINKIELDEMLSLVSRYKKDPIIDYILECDLVYIEETIKDESNIVLNDLFYEDLENKIYYLYNLDKYNSSFNPLITTVFGVIYDAIKTIAILLYNSIRAKYSSDLRRIIIYVESYKNYLLLNIFPWS